MARRKTRRVSVTKHRTTFKRRTRRRIGATALNFSATSPLVKWGSVLLGFMKPDLLPIKKIVGDKLDSKIVAGAEAGLGFLLAMRKGKKTLPLVILGGYLLGAGVKKGMAAFGIGGLGPYGEVPVVAGLGPYGLVPVIGKRRLAGYNPSGTLGGYNPSGSINKVMGAMGTVSTGNGSGSTITPGDPGSDMMP